MSLSAELPTKELKVGSTKCARTLPKDGTPMNTTREVTSSLGNPCKCSVFSFNLREVSIIKYWHPHAQTMVSVPTAPGNTCRAAKRVNPIIAPNGPPTVTVPKNIQKSFNWSAQYQKRLAKYTSVDSKKPNDNPPAVEGQGLQQEWLDKDQHT